MCPCFRCLEKRFEDDLNKGTRFKLSSVNEIDESAADMSVENIMGPCNRKNASLGDIENEGLKTYFHRTVDCPIFYNKAANKSPRTQRHVQ